MNKKTAVIFGITGQDGSYLTELLLSKGYTIHGMVRRNSVTENQQSRIEKLSTSGNIHLHYGDLLDTSSIHNILRLAQPDEIYNLAAQSHVRVSFEIPQYTSDVNAIGVLNVLEAVRQICPTARVYQASSSEMFGNSYNDDFYQNEDTPMHPVSPYGCSKLYAYHITQTYNVSYGIDVRNGILFNHESPRRGSNFVSTKIVKNAVLISKGIVDKLELGNLDAKRDWGHSEDYVRAMWSMMQLEKQKDPIKYVISTGEAHSVREFCDVTFNILGLDYRDYVVQNAKFLRPNELHYLRGDCGRAIRDLGWKPEKKFDDLIKEMVDYWQLTL